jgi:ABC-type transport system substrate-binding protein
MKRVFTAIIVLAILLYLGAIVFINKNIHDSIIRVGLPGAWKTLQPGLQHTLFGDLVLSNKFEALVGVNDNGVSIPLGAKRWEIADDFRVFRFFIDNEKTYSDGSKLTAYDYKRSWEDAARLESISANSGLLELLYKIEGYSDFEKTGKISGIIVRGDELLEVHFSSPFRMALQDFQGSRYAAFKKVGGLFLGTGIYTFDEVAPDHVIMRPRQDLSMTSSMATLDVKFIPGEAIIEKLLNGEIDIIHNISGHMPEVVKLNSPNIETIGGVASLHLTLSLNVKKGSAFANVKRRKALLSLVSATTKKNRTLLPLDPFFESNFQIYMPFQSGQLKKEECDALIKVGESNINDLIEYSKKHPIVVKASFSTRYVLDFLISTGLVLSNDSAVLPPDEFYSLTYANTGPDILVDAFSVASGDPDGIYHALGKNGSIRTPYVYSDEVGKLLESGRKIIDISKLDGHYQNVSRAFLSDVPMIHLGFARALTAYRKDRIVVDSTVLRRNRGEMHFIKQKP